MKRFLLSFAATALLAGSAIADEISVTWADQGYTNNQLVTEYTNGPLTVSFSKAGYVSSAKCIQIIKGQTVDVTLRKGYDIDKISIKGNLDYYWDSDVTFSNGSVTGLVDTSASEDDLDTLWEQWEPLEYQPIEYTANADVNTMTITNSPGFSTRFSEMTVTYHKRDDAKQEAVLSFPEKEYTVKLNETFSTPALTINCDAPVKYTSSNEEIATVDAATGAVTLVGIGTTVITATSEETATYYDGTASYTLNVIDYREDTVLSFPQQSYTTKLNQPFTAPELTTNSDAPLTYTSSNEAVATVDPSTGAVTLVGKGVTVITVVSAMNESYKEATASYTLRVQNAFNGQSVDIIWDECNFTNGQAVESYVESPVSILFEKGRNSALPRYYTSTKLNIQALNDITVSAEDGYVLTGITFTSTTASTNFSNDATADTGTLSGFSTTEVTWTPANTSTTSVKISNGMYNARLAGMTVKYAAAGTVGVEAIDNEDTTVEYYNLQGVRVANPENGIYVRVANGKATKIVK